MRSPGTTLRLFFVCCILSTFLIAATGGPDTYGYMWQDSDSGATYSWIEISGTGVDLNLNDSTVSAIQTLGFQFSYYGTNYNQLIVSSNGWISFDTTITDSGTLNTPIPDVAGPRLMIAPLWDDLDPPTLPGEVYFEDFGTYAVIQWDDVEKWDVGIYHTFEIILYDSGIIEFQYQTVGADTDDCTVGIENGAEDDGLQCLYNGTGVTLSDSYAIEFYTGVSVIDCTGATSISCGSTLTGITSNDSDVVTEYGCNGNIYDGDEEIFEFVLASESNVTIALTNFGNERLDVFLLSDCNELTNCIAWGDDSITYTQLPANTYHIVVDGERDGDTGPFDISISCDVTCTINCVSGTCDAGYESVLSEDFEGTWDGESPPAGWSIIDNGSLGDGWNGNDWDKYYYSTTTSNVARIYYTPIEDQDEELITPSVNCSAYTDVYLEYWTLYADYSPDSTDWGYVDISIGGGGWQNLYTYVDADATETRRIDITAYAAGESDVRVRWRYIGNDDMWWYVDDVMICGSPAASSADCSSAQSISCPYSSTDTTSGGTTEIDCYVCDTYAYAGSEKMYEITFAGPTVVDIALTNYVGRDMNVLLLSSCAPCSCIAAGPTISETVPAGTYTIIVDGYTLADDGAFDIDITCTDPCDTIPTISCGATQAGDTSDDTDDFDPPCGTSGGNDEMWKLVYSGPVGSNINLEILDPGWDHVLYVLSDCTDENSCTDWVDSGSIDITTTTNPQTFFIVVDGYSTGSGTYDLTVICSANNLDCSSNIPLSCGSTVSVDTSSGNEGVASYNCDPGNYYYGPEVVYEFTTPSAGDITATLSNFTGDDLDLFILDACDSTSCLAYGDTAATVVAAPAGTYYLVIDSDKAGSSGTADLTITCPLPNNLNCAGAVDITCNTEIDGDTSAGLAGQSRYECGIRDLPGNELIYHLDLTGATGQTYILATLSNTGGRDLDLVLLDTCNPNFCLDHQDTELVYLADPGDYYIIVDGVAALDNGVFHLEILCSTPSTLSCGGVFCDSGYEPILTEDFEGVWGPWGDVPPGGWTIIDSGSLADAWNENDWHNHANGAPQNAVAMVNYSPIEDQDEFLRTPVLDCSAYTSVILKFWHYYNDIGAGGDTGDVDLSKNGGGNFGTNIATYDADDLGSIETFDISGAAAGDNNIMLQWHYYNANDDWYWKVDDVAVCGSPSSSSSLSCPGADTIVCEDTLTSQPLGGVNNNSNYSCSTYSFDANEVVYRFTLAQVQTVDITLSNFGDEDLALFLLNDCDPCTCIEGGGTTISAYALSPGTYYIVVEGYDSTENDAIFDISMTCNDPCLSIPVISCNTPVSGDTSDDTNVIDPSCGGGAGPEEIWKLVFNGPVGSTLVISMPTPGFDHVLYVLDNCTDGTSCTDWVDSGDITLTTTTNPQTYYIVVDGYLASASGVYSDLLVTCPIPNNINCAAATPINCGDIISGDTIGLPNDGIEYAGVNGTFNGSDIIYALTTAIPLNLDFYLENHPGRSQFLFLLEVDTCNVNNVIEGGVGEIHLDNAPAGIYYLIVDGRTPFDNGTYDLRIVCNAPLTPSCSSSCTNTIFSEDFTGGLPGSWNVVNNGDCTGDAATWTDANPGGRLETAPISDPFMICDSDNAGTGCTMDEHLRSPVIDCTVGGPFTEIHLTFDHYFNAYAAEICDVMVNSSATGGWTVVATYTTVDSANPEAVDINITTEALGQTDLEVGFRYYNAEYEMYWMLDNVAVCGVAPGGTDVDCSSATVIACNSTTSGDTSMGGLANIADAYSCANDTYDGNEQVFELTIAEDTILEIILSNFGTNELDAFLLDSCSKCSCIAGGNDWFKYNVPAGTYYIVVDGFSTGDNSTFDLTVNCTSCVDPSMHNRWDVCENPRSPITASTTSALEWNFDDCDYCRDSGNSCFSTPCTFDMYIVAECGTEMHMPLYDNETGDLSIYDMTNGQYVYLYSQSTGGWTAEGTNIQWEDCGGIDPNWNDQTTDIWFYGAPTLCGVYRAEFVDWGGFIWDLFSNCTGTDSPGFMIYDNYCEALAAYDPYPALNVESMTITGSCPTYTVDYTISNAGCYEATTTVVAWSDLGGSTEEQITVAPGATESGSLVVNIQNSGIGSIHAYADFYDYVEECQETGGTATACSVSGGSAYLTEAINCGCAIPTFSTANVEDLTCPVGLRIFWNAAMFNSGNGHYDIYRSSVSFADAIIQPPIATNIAVLEYIDNSVTQFINYWYVVRAEDNAPAPGGCAAGPHGGMYTDVNVGPITDNLPSSVVDKPYDIGNDLRSSKDVDGSVILDWSLSTPAPETTHYHVYRTDDCTGVVPDDWDMICPDIPDPAALDPATQTWDDETAIVANLYFYDIRSANDCETICPDVLNINFTTNSPSCDGSGTIDLQAQVQGGIGPYSYDWDYGDGASCSTAGGDCLPGDTGPSHTYTFPPYEQTVTLTVTDATQPASQQEIVQKIVKFGNGVTASFTYEVNGLQVTFDGTAGGGSGSYSYSWTFGDNSTSTEEDPVHTYSSSGTYSVTFTVTDDQTGCNESDTQDVIL